MQQQYLENGLSTDCHFSMNPLWVYDHWASVCVASNSPWSIKQFTALPGRCPVRFVHMWYRKLNSFWHGLSLPVVGRAHGHNVDMALLIYKWTKKYSQLYYSLGGQFSFVIDSFCSVTVIENQEIGSIRARTQSCQCTQCTQCRLALTLEWYMKIKTMLKNHIRNFTTNMRFKLKVYLIKHPSFLFECFYDQQGSYYSCPKASTRQLNAKVCRVVKVFLIPSFCLV